MTTTEVDLNSDLGEGVRHLDPGRRRRPARDRHQRQRGLRLPRRRPGDHAPDLRAPRSSAGSRSAPRSSYRDLAGFGRRKIDMPRAELTADVLYQLGALDGVRPGRPATGCATSSRTARSTTRSSTTPSRPPRWSTRCVAYDRDAAGARAARLGVAARRPAAAGLTRGAGGLRRPRVHRRRPLVSRRQPGAVLHDPAAVARAVRGLATDRRGRRRSTGPTVAVAAALGLRARRHPGRGRAGPARSRPALAAAGVDADAVRRSRSS